MRKGCEVSQVRKHPAIISEHGVVLVSPGPALTAGLVLIFQLLRRISNVVFVHNHYPAEDLALLIVRDRGEDIQHGGVGPALVNLENKEISSEDIMVVSLTAHTL